MSGLGGYLAVAPQANHHLLDKMGSGSDLGLLTLGDIEPRAR